MKFPKIGLAVSEALRQAPAFKSAMAIAFSKKETVEVESHDGQRYILTITPVEEG